MKPKLWVAVQVEHRASGVIGTHYLEVDGSLVYPEENAKAQERERLGDDYRVLSAHLWNGGSGSNHGGNR